MEKTHQLILKNDNKNSFPKIVASLIRFCNHDIIQANQCANIAHNNKQCQIKVGQYIDMLDLKLQFDSKEIITEIQEYADRTI